MTDKTILITGSSGLVGYPLSKHLAAQGDRIVGHDPAAPPESIDGVTPIQEEFGDLDAMRALLADHDVGKIVHAGGISGPMLSNDAPHHITRTNIGATLDLAEAAYRAGIERLVYCTSVSAYGVMDEGPVREDAPLRPTNLYGATKAAMDHVLMAYRAEYGLDVIGLRYSTVYGPRRATDCVIRTMIEGALAERPTRLPQGAGRRWPFVYVDDVVSATMAALDAPAPAQYAYNVAGPDYPLMEDIAELIRAEFPGADIEIAGSPDDPVRERLDLTASERDLRWTPECPIDAGVKAYIDWMRASGA